MLLLLLGIAANILMLHSGYYGVFPLGLGSPGSTSPPNQVSDTSKALAKRVVVVVWENLNYEYLVNGTRRTPASSSNIIKSVLERTGRVGTATGGDSGQSTAALILRGSHLPPPHLPRAWLGWPHHLLQTSVLYSGSERVPQFLEDPAMPWTKVAYGYCDAPVFNSSYQIKWRVKSIKQLLPSAPNQFIFYLQIESPRLYSWLMLLPYDVYYVTYLIGQIYQEFEWHFKDTGTAYILTSFLERQEGLGRPVLLWGAGIEPGAHLDSPLDQTDLAPLIAALLGLPIPPYSEGVLPVEALNISISEKSELLFKNIAQLHLLLEDINKALTGISGTSGSTQLKDLFAYEKWLRKLAADSPLEEVVGNALDLLKRMRDEVRVLGRTGHWRFRIASLSYHLVWGLLLLTSLLPHLSCFLPPRDYGGLLDAFRATYSRHIFLYLAFDFLLLPLLVLGGWSIEPARVQGVVLAVLLWATVRTSVQVLSLTVTPDWREVSNFLASLLVAFSLVCLSLFSLSDSEVASFSLLLLGFSPILNPETCFYTAGVLNYWLLAVVSLYYSSKFIVLNVCKTYEMIYLGSYIWIGLQSAYIVIRKKFWLNKLLAYIAINLVGVALCLVTITFLKWENSLDVPQPVYRASQILAFCSPLLALFVSGDPIDRWLGSCFSLVPPVIMSSLKHEAICIAAVGLFFLMWLVIELGADVEVRGHQHIQLDAKDIRIVSFCHTMIVLGSYVAGNYFSLNGFDLQWVEMYTSRANLRALLGIWLFKIALPIFVVLLGFLALFRYTGTPGRPALLWLLFLTNAMAFYLLPQASLSLGPERQTQSELGCYLFCPLLSLLLIALYPLCQVLLHIDLVPHVQTLVFCLCRKYYKRKSINFLF